MPVPLLDLTRQYESLRGEMEDAALRVLRSTRYILGAECNELEAELARYLGARHVIGLSSGTDALLAALMAAGIGPGDAVAMPVYSFFATAGAVARLGARPVFVDVDEVFCNLDANALTRAVGADPAIKAVVFVHLYGAGAGLDAVARVCKTHGLALIEDAAQAIGTRVNGRMAGTVGLCGCFSTFPSKNLGGVGDGGFLCTDDDALAAAVRRLRNHGQAAAYEHPVVGGNFRLDELQAACLRVKLRHLEEFTQARRRNALRYRQLVAEAGLGDAIGLPRDVEDRHTYHQYVTHVSRGNRDAVRAALTERGIGCAVYYPLPFHLQPCFQSLGYRAGEFPVAERKARTNLALPIFPELREAEQREVVAALGAALGTAAAAVS